MLFELNEEEDKFVVKEKFIEKAASELGVPEKAIEDWIADHPNIL